MAIKGDIDKSKGSLKQQIKDLEKDFYTRKKLLEDRLKDLEDAEKLLTPAVEAVVAKLNLILGK